MFEFMRPDVDRPAVVSTKKTKPPTDVRSLSQRSSPGRLQVSLSGTVTGSVTVRLTLNDTSQPLVLDFAPGAGYLTSVAIAGRASAYHAVNGHIVIPQSEITKGENVVDIRFRAGDAALNRNPDFLYSLFVPARAHLTFPCFDQPDLKARFTLELAGPADWQTVSNGAETSREGCSRDIGERRRFHTTP